MNTKKINEFTHHIITFNVDDNGIMDNNTIKVVKFSGTDDEAIEKAEEVLKQRNKQEPLPDSEMWGKIEYLVTVFTLDESGYEDEIIYEG